MPVYDRALLLHGAKRDEVLSLAEVQQYGRDSSPIPTTSASTACLLPSGTRAAFACSAAPRSSARAMPWRI